MNDVQRYQGPGHRGAVRPLTSQESAQVRAAVALWTDTPPWTTKRLTDNAAVKSLFVSLFEDGVSLTALAAASNWGRPRVGGILHRCRMEGLMSGTRRYIAPAPRDGGTPKAPFRREMTVNEIATVRQLFHDLPSNSAGSRNWRSPEAGGLLIEIDRLTQDKVALSTLGDVLDMKRQAVHQHVVRFRASLVA